MSEGQSTDSNEVEKKKSQAGLENKPLLINLLSAVLFMIPVVILLLVLSPNQNNEMHPFMNLSLNVLLFSVGSYIVGLGIWRVRSWGYISFLVFTGAVVLYNIYRFAFHREDVDAYNVIVSLLVLFGMVILLQRNIAAPYFHPRIRWWERNPRVPRTLDVEAIIQGQTYRAPVLDVSTTGVFLSIDVPMKIGDIFKLHLLLLDFDFTVDCKVVRLSQKPMGYGAIFVKMTMKDRQTIRQIFSYLKQTEIKSDSDKKS